MTETPSITAVVPVYNGASTLRCALESILEQTFEDFEVLVVDDGSTDHPEAVLPDDPRIRFIRFEENRGHSVVTNFAQGEGRAPWMTYIDSDDTIESTRFEALFARAEETAADAVLTAMNFVNEDGQKRSAPWSAPDSAVSGAEAIDLVLSGRTSYGQHMLFRRPPASVYGDEDNVYADLEYCFRILARSRRVAYVSEALYNYTIHSSSTTGRLRENVWDLVAGADEVEPILHEVFGAHAPQRVDRLHTMIVQQLLFKAAREPEPTRLRAEVYDYCRPRLHWSRVGTSLRAGDRKTAISLALACVDPKLHRSAYRMWNTLKVVRA